MKYSKAIQPLLLLIFISIPNLIEARQNKPGGLRLEPYLVKGFKGQRVRAELGHLFVPENRTSPQSRLIELTFIRFRSASKSPGPPTIFLTGGPGVSAYYHARSNIGSPLYNALQEVGDLILLEQRGTFKSKPNLQCDGEIDYPLDKPLEPKELLRRYKEQCRSCKKHWQEQGVDLTGYNTIESADDIVKVTVGKLDLQFLLITLSVSVQRVSAFPEIAYAMSKGDFSPLAEYSLREREGKIGSAMSYMMDCASSVSPERLEKIKREQKSTLVGNLIDFPFPEICEEMGSARPRSDVPLSNPIKCADSVY